MGLKAAEAASAKSSKSKAVIEETVPARPWTDHLNGEVSGSYSWGTYSAPGVPSDAHVGMALPLYIGYRFDSGPNVGLASTFAFPEVSVRNAISDASFTYFGLGLQAGYLWKKRIEPFASYYPFSRLSQSTESRVGSGTVQTDLTYSGQTFGGGAKLYLTDRENGSVQIGLKFSYAREHYSRSKLDSHIQAADGQVAPAFTPVSAPQSGDQNVDGDTYQLGLFIGI